MASFSSRTMKIMGRRRRMVYVWEYLVTRLAMAQSMRCTLTRT